jgi:hypothetical protein
MWLFGDSFDHYTTAQVSRKWNNPGTETVIGATGRNGTNGVTPLNSALTKVLDNPAPASAVVVAGVAMRCFGSCNGAIVSIAQTGTVHFTLGVNPDYTLYVKRGTSSGTLLGASIRALNQGVWFYIEVKVTIDAAVGTVEVRVNGEPWIGPLTDQNTRGAASTDWNNFLLGSTNGAQTVNAYFDDLYVLDGSDSGIVGNPLNDFLGDTRGEALLPSGNGANSDWNGSDGNQVDNYALVADNPADDETSYVQSQTVGHKDTYAFPAIASDGTIRHVCHLLAMRKTDTATKTVVSVCRDSGGTDRDHAYGQNPGQITYDYYRANYPGDPNTGAAWVKANLAASQFGQKVTL